MSCMLIEFTLHPKTVHMRSLRIQEVQDLPTFTEQVQEPRPVPELPSPVLHNSVESEGRKLEPSLSTTGYMNQGRLFHLFVPQFTLQHNGSNEKCLLGGGEKIQ